MQCRKQRDFTILPSLRRIAENFSSGIAASRVKKRLISACRLWKAFSGFSGRSYCPRIFFGHTSPVLYPGSFRPLTLVVRQLRIDKDRCAEPRTHSHLSDTTHFLFNGLALPYPSRILRCYGNTGQTGRGNLCHRQKQYQNNIWKGQHKIFR